MARQGKDLFFSTKGDIQMSDMKVAWKRGFRGASLLSASTAHNELEKIRKKNDGELRKADVVESAKSARHKLHRFFEWDDSKAANDHRLWQAGRLIASIEVVIDEAPDKGTTRQYEISRSKTDPAKQSYQRLEDVMKTADGRADLMKRALSELIAVRRRYHMLQELAIVFREIDAVIEEYQP